jgi:hypothetical protein
MVAAIGVWELVRRRLAWLRCSASKGCNHARAVRESLTQEFSGEASSARSEASCAVPREEPSLAQQDGMAEEVSASRLTGTLPILGYVMAIYQPWSSLKEPHTRRCRQGAARQHVPHSLPCKAGVRPGGSMPQTDSWSAPTKFPHALNLLQVKKESCRC